MAAKTLNPTTPAISGAALVAASGTAASSDTVVISATTAQSILNFRSLAITVANASSTASVVLSLGAGDNFSEVGQGAYSITVATEATVIIGGQGFEGARFQDSDGAITFTQAGAGPTTWTATQGPNVWE